MRVSAKSNAGNVAGAVVGLIRSGKDAELECVGAVSTYKAICSVVIVTEFLEKEMVKPIISVSQEKRNIGGVNRKTLIMKVEGVKNG